MLRVARVAESRELAIAPAFSVVLRGRLTVELEDGCAFAANCAFEEVNVVDSARRGGSLIRLTTRSKIVSGDSSTAGRQGGRKNILDTLEARADEPVAASDGFGGSVDEVDRNVGDFRDALDVVILHGVAKRIDPNCVLVCEKALLA